MIVGSLLLILVAVTLLILGLGGGSSVLLIGSIVASLLAAVALVIGARQAANNRRPAVPDAEPAPVAVDLDDDPGRVTPVEATVGWASRSGQPDPFARAAAGPTASAAQGATTQGATTQGATTQSATKAQEAPATAGASAAPGATSASRADAEILDRDPNVRFSRDLSDDDAFGSTADEADPDRPQDGEDPYADARDLGARDFEAHERDGRERRPADPDADVSDPRDVDPDTDPAVPGADADAVQHTGTDDGDTDDEDPADEPAPQRIQPGDAVRVSRMIAEVLVVDGRPRYHLGDCPSLDGRVTEPLPASEAVELGFTPCSMCRPVDRLVAEAAHR